MSDKYPNSWYHGHKHVLQALEYVRSDAVDVGVETVRESLFEIEIDITFGPGVTVQQIAAIQDQLSRNGFQEREGAHEDNAMKHRFEWTYDGY